MSKEYRMMPISNTDLILNPDGSIYHLRLLPEDIADQIILVGDPARVAQVSSHFDHIEIQKSNREFHTHTGIYRGKRITALSTGIGTDNIDIVLNELDALVNVDLERRIPMDDIKGLNLIRIGTSGALQAGIRPGEPIIARIAGGFDSLYHFYQDPGQINMDRIVKAFKEHTGWKETLSDPYFIKGSDELYRKLASEDMISGITLSTPGFYAPQIRSIRLSPFSTDLISQIANFRFDGLRINNFEMESSALYALAALSGHRAISICVAIANRVTREFLKDYHGAVDRLIMNVLNKLNGDD